MRNTPYPAKTIGSRSHDIVRLHEAKGLIQGIEKFTYEEVISMYGLVRYQYIPEGESQTFEEPTHIELVDFHGTVSRYGVESAIIARGIKLEKGARLVGPATWRLSAEKSDHELPKKFNGRLAYVLTLLIILIFGGLLALISLDIAIPFVATGVIALQIFPIISAYGKMTFKSIERLGSAYVLAPKKAYR